jgi:hypothetical protein
MKNLFAKISLLMISLILGIDLTFAQEVEFKGWGATGFKYFSRNRLNGSNQEVYYEGKLQADIEINKKIEAQLDLRGNSTDRSVNFREFSVKFDFFKYLNFKVGNIKRPFGYQYIEVSREDLVTIDRSPLLDRVNELGYGGRSVSLMGYYKYSDKRTEFPYSYYASIFTNNSQNYGAAGRFGYHFDKSAVAVNLLFQSQGGEEPISGTGFALDYSLDTKKFNAIVELYYAQDLIEGVIRRLQNTDEVVNVGGASITGAYKFDVDGEIIKKLEPVLTAGIFLSDFDNSDNHVLQSIIGLNLYFHKKVLARINGDIRLTKNEFNDDYTGKESRFILELLVKF